MASAANAQNLTSPLNRTRQVEVVDVDEEVGWRTILSWFGGTALILLLVGGVIVLLARFNYLECECKVGKCKEKSKVGNCKKKKERRGDSA